MKTFDDWLNEGRKVENEWYAKNTRVNCADGYSISIQASAGHYCRPRETMLDVRFYGEFELGYPSVTDEALLEYAEDMESPTDTVYPYVPREVIEKVISSHGGIVSLENTKAA